MSLGKPLPVAIVTLKHRLLHPAAQLLIEQARKATASKAGTTKRATRG
ncbi:hypothetical protein [Bradyrhizobium sp. 2S1]|nr:hypothetical protein [Bradyrhizobium sp. 2S1]MCK7671350.1 hypothetical protein [Bradyrhizobium sp. 2S1]